VLSPNIPRFEFGEATAPVSLLPGVNACGGSAFTQVRTRSAATSTSDLKDATKIFEFLFEPLSVSASKTSQSAANSTVTLTATAGLTSYQWQVRTGPSTWANISGATNSTLTYSNFETDDTTADVLGSTFTVGGDTYAGKVFSVDLRVHATKTTGSTTCQADSAAVTVKKLVAVDP
jgi:hypothetical protein